MRLKSGAPLLEIFLKRSVREKMNEQTLLEKDARVGAECGGLPLGNSPRFGCSSCLQNTAISRSSPGNIN